MRRSVRIVAICLLTGLAIALPANAQCTVNNFGAALPNPSTWAFTIADGFGNATIGVFTLSVGPGRSGPLTPILSLVESFDNSGDIEQEVAMTGIYSVDPTATGPCAGQLNFPGSANVLQLRFQMSPSGTQMFLASVTVVGNGPNDHSNGKAVLLPSGNPGCAGGNALFSGVWSFLTHDYGQDVTIGTMTAPDSTGMGRAPATGWSSLAVTETVGDFPSFVQNTVHGSYRLSMDLNGNCFGGSLQFDSGAGIHSYAFVFSGGIFAPFAGNEIYMVDTNAGTVGSGPRPSVNNGYFGSAVRSPI